VSTVGGLLGRTISHYKILDEISLGVLGDGDMDRDRVADARKKIGA
jgi:hypothetical protein